MVCHIHTTFLRVAVTIPDAAGSFYDAGGSLYHSTVRRFYNGYKHTHRTPPSELGLDFSRFRSSPAAPLVVYDALMVHDLLVSDDDTVLK
jgi:hypothetical protein